MPKTPEKKGDSIRLRRWMLASVDTNILTPYERDQFDEYFATGDPLYLPEEVRKLRDSGAVLERRGELHLEGE